MKAIIIISLAVIALLLLLRRISGYSPQCWRGNCKTEQIQDINGNLVTVPNMDCLRASSMDEYCVFTTSYPYVHGDRQTLRDDPQCEYKRGAVESANSQSEADEAAANAEAAEHAADAYMNSFDSSNNDSWGGNSNASIS